MKTFSIAYRPCIFRVAHGWSSSIFCTLLLITNSDTHVQMVFYFESNVVQPPAKLFMGLDKFENEELIRWGWPEDVWFHVDKVRGQVCTRTAHIRAVVIGARVSASAAGQAIEDVPSQLSTTVHSW